MVFTTPVMNKKSTIPLIVLVPLFLILFSTTSTDAQKLPLGYIEYFNHACNKTDLFRALSVADSASWMIVVEEPVNVLRIDSKDSLANDYPQSRAMLSKWILGDFILKFEFRHVPRDTTSALGFTFLAVARNADTYYAYTFTQDSLRFYYIRDSTVKCVDSQPLKGLKSGWNTLNVKRDILSRSIMFTMNSSKESLIFLHRDLVMGYLGFGNHMGTSYLKNIKLWAPTVIDETPFIW